LEGRKVGSQGGGQEGSKEGRQEGRREGRKEKPPLERRGREELPERVLPWGRKADERQESEEGPYLNIPRNVSDWQQR